MGSSILYICQGGKEVPQPQFEWQRATDMSLLLISIETRCLGMKANNPAPGLVSGTPLHVQLLYIKCT